MSIEEATGRDRTGGEAARRWTRLALLTFAAAGAAWLLTRHADHVVQLLPYALLLACPLMHMMHHGRHGGHRQKDG